MLESKAWRTALGVTADITVTVVLVDVGLNFLCPKNLTGLLKIPTSKQTDGPDTNSASDFA